MLKQKSDGPTKRIVAALKEVGASVEYIRSRAGRGKGGMPDLLCAKNGTVFLLEVKSDNGELSKEQIAFHGRWKSKIYVAKNEQEALAIYDAI